MIAPVQFSSVTQSYQLATPWTEGTPGFPVHHQLAELTHIHVHRVGDAIQPSHPLLSPSLPAFNLSQNQGLFQSWPFTSDGQSSGASASVGNIANNYISLYGDRQ